MRTKAFGTATALLAALALFVAPTATAGGTMLSTDLVGAEERPGPGDPDGHGFIELTLNQGRGQICYSVTASAIDTVTGGHVHRAPAGSPGDVVVPLFGSTGFGEGCVSAAKALIKEIRQNPTAFYVNVHTDTFPGGAIRGQLGD